MEEFVLVFSIEELSEVKEIRFFNISEYAKGKILSLLKINQ
ncbi:hypothetical protein V4D30_01315 [Thermodesulfovibrio sp. 3907-1M]|uniref:Uncharacterized protein n=1 Tax=Thermodesulfovibrio autotrophicus TaxID=3118333 RepID=A0AAU8H089_9BACT